MVPPRYGRQAEDGPCFARSRHAGQAIQTFRPSALAALNPKDPTRKAKPLRSAAARSRAGIRSIRASASRTRRRRHGYRIKPHGQLVLVSSRPHGPSTSSLSTSWSWTTLQGGQASGKTNLQASFPLRCFQRLSLPHIATRRCHWRDNRYTRGASTPVLSY